MTKILKLILKLWKIWEKQISTWYAITSCRYSTGQEPNWNVRETTDLPFLPTTRPPLTAWIRKKCSTALKNDMNGTVMPGWEPERMEKVKELFALYKDVDEEKLFENLVYFLKAIMPVCDKYDINMAIHPDDPSWSVFGLPPYHFHTGKTEENDGRCAKQTQRRDLLHGLLRNQLKQRSDRNHQNAERPYPLRSCKKPSFQTTA